MTQTTVELAPFRLADGVTEDELKRASEAVQSAFLEKQEGYLRRELLRQDERSWCDLVYWSSPEAAHRAVSIAMESPVCQRYFALMVPGDGVRHFAVEATYG